MKKNYYCTLLATVLFLVACEQESLMDTVQQFEETTINQIVSGDYSMLEFSSRADFYAMLGNGDETRSATAKSFISLLDEIPNLSRSSSPEIEGESYCDVQGYDELIPNKNFAKLINPNGEIMINDTIYMINRNGTYYFPKNKENEFSAIYKKDSIGTEISEDLYILADDIYRFDSFKDLANAIDINLDSLNEGMNYVETRAAGDPDYNIFPTFDADRHTWLGGLRQGLFGNDKWYNVDFKNISKTRRVYGRLYAYHYVFYSESGITG